MSPRRSDARKRMLDAASTLVRERGASATSLDDILAHSQAPRGSVYYHFPGGRTQLIEEASSMPARTSCSSSPATAPRPRYSPPSSRHGATA